MDEVDISMLVKTELGRKKLAENFDSIKEKYFYAMMLEHSNVINFLNFIKQLKDVPELQNEYGKYSYWAELYDQIKVPEPQGERPSIGESHRDVNKRKIWFAQSRKDDVFEKIIISSDIDREEQMIILQHIANGNKYEYKSCGISGLVIQAGDQIIKLARSKTKFEVPYHPRIMMPYFRKKYSNGTCLEIFNYGITESAKITDDKLLEIYKELEKDGILWGDARKDNLVVLTKDNVVPDFVQSEDFNLFGFLEDERFPTKNHRALKKGDIVICDLDMLYPKDDPNYQEGKQDPIIKSYIKNQRARKLPEEH